MISRPRLRRPDRRCWLRLAVGRTLYCGLGLTSPIRQYFNSTFRSNNFSAGIFVLSDQTTEFNCAEYYSSYFTTVRHDWTPRITHPKRCLLQQKILSGCYCIEVFQWITKNVHYEPTLYTSHPSLDKTSTCDVIGHQHQFPIDNYRKISFVTSHVPLYNQSYQLGPMSCFA